MAGKLDLETFLTIHRYHQYHKEEAPIVAIVDTPGQDGHDECLRLFQTHCDECGSDSAPYSLPSIRTKVAR